MWIEPRQHAAHGIVDQSLVVHRFDVVALDVGEDVGEGPQLRQRQGASSVRSRWASTPWPMVRDTPVTRPSASTNPVFVIDFIFIPRGCVSTTSGF